MWTLRPYQQEAKRGILGLFEKGLRRVLFILPTGGGKTVTFVDVIHDTVRKGNRAMIICDRKELITQALAKVKDLGLLPTIIAPGFLQLPNNVYLASVDTLRRRELPIVDILIIDEAHKQSFAKRYAPFSYLSRQHIKYLPPYLVLAQQTPRVSFCSEGQQ